MNKKLYVVTCDGVQDGYGSYIYLVGVFDNRKDAENARDAAAKVSNDEFASITEVDLNKEYPLVMNSDFSEATNENLLGGYME